MPNETFAVTTIHFVGDLMRTERKTTIARDRVQAIRQAERIGEIDERDQVRNFLEGAPMVRGHLCLRGWFGVATVNLIEE